MTPNPNPMVYEFTLGSTFEKVNVNSIADWIEGLCLTKNAFYISQQTSTTLNLDELRRDLREYPLLAYGGEDTYPFISEWREAFKGLFLLDVNGRRIVYGADGTPPLLMRDSYTWRMSAKRRFLATVSVREIIDSFLNSGYELFKDQGRRYTPEKIATFSQHNLSNPPNKTFTDYQRESVDLHFPDFVPMETEELDLLF